MKIFKKDDVNHDIVDCLMIPNYCTVKTDELPDEQLDIDRWENDGGRSASQI